MSLLQWCGWRSTSSEPVQSMSLLQWHSVLDTFFFLYIPCQYRAFALLKIWVVIRVCYKLWALREWHARHSWSLSVVSTEVWDNCIRLKWNAKHWYEWLRAESVFKQWVCFNGIIKVNLFNESVWHIVSLLQWHTVVKVNLFTEQVDKTSCQVVSLLQWQFKLSLPLWKLTHQCISSAAAIV